MVEEHTLNDGENFETLQGGAQEPEKNCGELQDEQVQLSEIDKLKNELAASRADLYNYRQRVERDRIKTRKLVIEDKICEFLPVLDNLDRALNVPEDGSVKDVLVGVRMVQRQFLSVLEASDVTVIPAEGCDFDPMIHDAVEIERVDDLAMDGKILFEIMRGYKTQDRVLRASQVRVARA